MSIWTLPVWSASSVQPVIVQAKSTLTSPLTPVVSAEPLPSKTA
jgi:hypothetical protein